MFVTVAPIVAVALADDRDGLADRLLWAVERVEVPIHPTQWDELRAEFSAANLVEATIELLSRARTEAEIARVSAIVNHMRFAVADIVNGAAAALESDDQAVRQAAVELLRHHEDGSASREADFSMYRAYVEARVQSEREPSAALLRHMFASDAGLALRTLVRGFQIHDPLALREILWAERNVDTLLWKRRMGFVEPTRVERDAVSGLTDLANHRLPWVRAYVAQILVDHRDLRGPGLIDILSRDESELVQSIMATP
jgi:hypothetical protein